MKLEKIVQKFQSHPKYMTYGAGKMSKVWHCSIEDIKEARRLVRGKSINPSKIPKILIFDLETAPLKGYVWSRWQQNVYPAQLVSDWFLLTWSAKWLYSSEIMSGKLTSKEVFAENDKRIVKKLWKLVDEADIIIAHNGDRFDVPKLNSRFLVNGLKPPSAYKTIDTLKTARSQFGFSSNALAELGKILGLGGKLSTGFELWAKCMNGDEDAIAYMQKYNDQDVVLLEEIYLALRPYMRSHPNSAVYNDDAELKCSLCGSTHIHNEGFYYTNTAKFNQYRCDSCSGLSRGRVNVFSKEKKKSLLTSIPR